MGDTNILGFGVKQSDLDKLADITVSAENINLNTKKVFDKIVRKINKNPTDHQFQGLSGGYNAYANIIKYNLETFNAIKVYVKVKANTTLRVELIDPAQFNNANWWQRIPIIRKDKAITPQDDWVTIQFDQLVTPVLMNNIPYVYVAISTVETVTVVQLATHDVEVTNTDLGGYSHQYSVGGTQKNTTNGFRFYPSALNNVIFAFELLYIGYDGVEKEYLEQVFNQFNRSDDIVHYQNFYNCDGNEAHIYFSNFKKYLNKNYRYEYECFPYDLALATELRMGVQEEERFMKYNKLLTFGNNSQLAHINFFEKKFKEPDAVARFNHITVAKTNGAGLTVNMVCVGESTTADGIYTQRLLDIEANDDLTLVLKGTRGSVDTPNRHEGVGGMTMTWHNSHVDSAFTNTSGVFDYPAFITAIGNVVPDVISIQIGINAMLMVKNKYDLAFYVDREMAATTSFINNIKAAQPNTKFIVNTCILPSERQSSFGKNYSTYLNQDLYRESVQTYNEALFNLFKNRESENLYLNCGMTLSLDCVNGFAVESKLLSEHTTITATRGANAVHPFEYGYKLMGDALWACLKYIYRP